MPTRIPGSSIKLPRSSSKKQKCPHCGRSMENAKVVFDKKTGKVSLLCVFCKHKIK